MNIKPMINLLKQADIDKDTISFFQSIDDDQPDTEFTYCDLTGLHGECVTCIALSIKTGRVVQFQVLQSLVGGELGRVAGAF